MSCNPFNDQILLFKSIWLTFQPDVLMTQLTYLFKELELVLSFLIYVCLSPFPSGCKGCSWLIPFLYENLFINFIYIWIPPFFFLCVSFGNFETHQRLRPLHWLWPIRRSILMICSVGKSLQTFLFGSLCYVFAKWWIDWSSFFALLNVIEALVIGCSDLLRWIGSF